MKIVVDSMPDSPSECLFLKDYYKETCKFDGEICVFSSCFNSVKEEEKICHCLIELKELNK